MDPHLALQVGPKGTYLNFRKRTRNPLEPSKDLCFCIKPLKFQEGHPMDPHLFLQVKPKGTYLNFRVPTRNPLEPSKDLCVFTRLYDSRKGTLWIHSWPFRLSQCANTSTLGSTQGSHWSHPKICDFLIKLYNSRKATLWIHIWACRLGQGAHTLTLGSPQGTHWSHPRIYEFVHQTSEFQEGHPMDPHLAFQVRPKGPYLNFREHIRNPWEPSKDS